MTYKGMLLSALLVPVAVTSYGQESVDPRIQQLKEARFQKELELSELDAKIVEKKELLTAIFDDTVAMFVERYKPSETSKMTDEERVELGGKIVAEYKEFRNCLKQAIEEGNIKDFMVKELFDEDTPWNFTEFEAMKFLIVRDFFETNLLKTLVGFYANCFQEIIEIDCELNKP